MYECVTFTRTKYPRATNIHSHNQNFNHSINCNHICTWCAPSNPNNHRRGREKKNPDNSKSTYAYARIPRMWNCVDDERERGMWRVCFAVIGIQM